MRKLLGVLLALLLSGCAHVQPVVKYTCMGCTALLASGVCALATSSTEVPACREGDVLVILNWSEMTENGAAPIFGCAKEK